MRVIDNMDVDINKGMIDWVHQIGKKFVREETEDSENSEVTVNEDREVLRTSSQLWDSPLGEQGHLFTENVRVPGTKSKLNLI